MTNQEFIEAIAGCVRKYADSYGIKVHSPIIAQAILESGWGKSSLSAKYHNYFGMKCGSSWTGKSVNLTTKEEYTVGTLTTIKDNFRVYDSMEEGVKGYFDFISTSRYYNLKGITDPQKYLETIKGDGYATSSTYVSNNMKVISDNNLTRYDGKDTGMTVILGSARIDERGKTSGGQAGDQTGKEVSTQSYYNHSKGWYCLRPKDYSVALKIAAAMKQACDNNHIGYDQSGRCGVITNLKKYGSLAKISVNTEADCSSLVRACIIQATGIDVGDFYTATEADVLEKSGLFEKRISVTSSTQVCTGDVLVTKTKGHTVVVVFGHVRNVEYFKTDIKFNAGVKEWQRSMNIGFDTKELAEDGLFGQKSEAFAKSHLLKYNDKGHPTAVRWLQKKLGITADGVFGNKTKNAVISFQKNHGLEPDGVVGLKTYKALLGV